MHKRLVHSPAYEENQLILLDELMNGNRGHAGNDIHYLWDQSYAKNHTSDMNNFDSFS